MRSDGSVTPLLGRPAELVTLLAAVRRRMRSAEVAAALWPDVATAKARERLRTVLARLRREYGCLVVRDGGAIALARGVRVDLWDFDDLADQALRHRGVRGTEAAREALDMFEHELAADVRPHAWLTQAQERHRLRCLGLHDRLADEAEHHDRPEQAAAVLLDALHLDPLAEHRAVRAARLLAVAGDRGRAMDLLGRTRWRLEREGLGPGAQLEHLASYLGRCAGPGLTRA